MITEYNDRIGNRDCQSHCCLVSTEGVVYPFSSQGVEGVFGVAVKGREKNGKWSNTTWLISHAATTEVIAWRDDFHTGHAINALTWTEAYLTMKAKAPELRREAHEEYVRKHFPVSAKRLDIADRLILEFGVQLSQEEADSIVTAKERAEAELAAHLAEREVARKNSPFAALLGFKP